MKRRVVEIVERADHFSNLPDDLLDVISQIQVTGEQWITVPGFFQVLQRCVRLSLVSRCHREWWLKRSRWSCDTTAIVREGVKGSTGDIRLFKNLCRLVDCSSDMKNGLQRFISHYDKERVRLFNPMIYNWRDNVHKSHEQRYVYLGTESLMKYYTKEPCSPQLLELLLAFYHIVPSCGKERPMPRVHLTLPQPYNTIGQLFVYQEKEEDLVCNVTVSDSMASVNVHQLTPLRVNPSNIGTGVVYALHPPSYVFKQPFKLASDIQTSLRLYTAIAECKKAFIKKRGPK